MNFIFFSPISWDNMEGAHRPVRFASELAQRGHQVLYVELPKSIIKTHAKNIRIINLVELGMTEQHVLAAYYGFDYGSPETAQKNLAQLLARHAKPGEKNIAIMCAPFRPFLEFLPVLAEHRYSIVFDLLDDFAAMHGTGYYCYDRDATQFLTRYSDLVLPLSDKLLDKYHALGAPNLALIRDGIDTEFWWNARDHQVSLARGTITLGFWGWLWHHNVNVSLLSYVAQARPAWQIHLVGPYEPTIAEILNLPNIHFHDKVGREWLPAYARNFDVCLFPAPNDEFNQSRDPLKVYEYLACHKPVVATDQPQLGGMPDVYLSHSADEFIANVERAAHDEFDITRARAFLSEQTWAKRVDILVDEIAKLGDTPRAMPSPPRGAMPNAQKELERVQAYAQHLERLVADREAHIANLEHAISETAILEKLKRLATWQTGK